MTMEPRKARDGKEAVASPARPAPFFSRASSPPFFAGKPRVAAVEEAAAPDLQLQPAVPLPLPDSVPPPPPPRVPLRVIPGGGGAPPPPAPTPPPGGTLGPAARTGAGFGLRRLLRVLGPVGTALDILLTPSPLAPPWMSELNPETGGPYKGPQEYEDVKRRRREKEPQPVGPEEDPWGPPESTPQPQPQPQPQPEPKPKNPEKECRETHPSALTCSSEQSSRQAAVDNFLAREGITARNYTWKRMPDFGIGEIDACDGAPGERWHVTINGNPNLVVSVFGCLCCQKDGQTSLAWRGAHWSDNASRRGGGK